MSTKRFRGFGQRDAKAVASATQMATDMSTTELQTLPRLSTDFFVALVDELWRLTGRIDRLAADGRADENVRLLRDSHRRLGELLESVGVTIVDYSGQPYVEGTRFDIAYMSDGTDPGEPLVVRETLRPGVFWQGVLIRPAQVVLGQSEGKPT